MPEIPLETQELINKFLAEEKSRREVRDLQKGGGEGEYKKRITEGSRPMTANEVINLAVASGWCLESGGNHLKLVKGSVNVPIPHHGGSGRTLATGTQRSILKALGLSGK